MARVSIDNAVQTGDGSVSVRYLKSRAIANQLAGAVRRSALELISHTTQPQEVGGGAYWTISFQVVGGPRIHDARFAGANSPMEANTKALENRVKAALTPGHLVLTA